MPVEPLQMNRRLALACLVFAAATIVGIDGCGKQASGERSLNYPLQVLCTTGQVADLVRNVGGRHVTVDALMGPSVDPHQYKATLGDRRKMEDADVIFYNGLHLEGRMTDALEDMGRRRAVYAVTEGIPREKLRKPEEFEGGYDPHVWFDVRLWILCTEEVSRRLIELDPEHEADYRGNASSYIKHLRVLDQTSRDELAAIPKAQRVLVTAHDAFGYFGQAYDIEVRGLQGISTADETDIATKQKLVDLLVERKVKAVFVESSVPHRNVENLIDLCARRGHTLTIGGELYSDAMGPEGSSEATYDGMFVYNVKTIVEALK
jgi:manganese/zinc/iron transport system substrate-binding protein